MIRDLLPASWRRIVYAVLGVASAVQAAFGVFDDGAWGRCSSFVALLGFTLAAGNTGHPPVEEVDDAEVM